MNISFDLDSTLIPNGNEFDTEKANLITNLFGLEKIRKGASSLIASLQNQGHEIHIYSTSFRSKTRIRFNLFCYGIKVGRIINQEKNQKTLKSLNIYSSKYPPAFGFDIHIDDSKGVGIEAERFNFKTIIIEPTDTNWVETVIYKLIKFIKQPY
jgi:hypothetical protein